MTPSPEQTRAGPRRVSRVVLACGALLAAEFLALMLRFTTAAFDGASQQWGQVLLRSTVLPQLALTCATGVALFSGSVLERELRAMRDTLQPRASRVPALALQLFCFALLYFATWQVFEVHVPDAAAPWAWICVWVIAASATVVTGAGLFLSGRDLILLARRTKKSVGIAVAIGVIAWILGFVSANELRLPLRTPTLWLSRNILALFSDDVAVDVSQFVFGTTKFAVQIAPQCSGLDGIGLLLAFTLAYLWIARDSLRFPHAFLIPVLGMVAAWVFNSLRLAGLVAIGSWISPDLAVGGFHTLAGLIAFCGISLGIVWWSQRSAYFRSERSIQIAIPAERNLTLALLGPFLVFMACGALLNFFAHTRAQMYPLQPLAAVAALLLLRRAYARPELRAPWTGIVAGTLAFAVWSLFAPTNTPGPAAENSHLVPGDLEASSRAIWIAARVIGYGLVTPLIEELAFRSYLLRRLTSRDFEHVPLTGFSWTALVASSMIFGALHESWARAAIAGMIYGLAMRRRGRVSDAVIAHATTNLLLLTQAFVRQDWALLG
ncbi:MAG TPA: exosortase E/protease, VPEID-CTERM system [Planctomycetota bacterium]|nr:exosortase E/protease, VPEID-CTERM system [Planctomycetota bacterium]